MNKMRLLLKGSARGHARTGVRRRPAEDAPHPVAAAGQAGEEDGQLLDSAVPAAAGAAAAVQPAFARQAAVHQGAAPRQQRAANEEAERGRLYVARVAGSASLRAK
jgi:hypothetical protein